MTTYLFDEKTKPEIKIDGSVWIDTIPEILSYLHSIGSILDPGIPELAQTEFWEYLSLTADQREFLSIKLVGSNRGYPRVQLVSLIDLFDNDGIECDLRMAVYEYTRHLPYKWPESLHWGIDSTGFRTSTCEACSYKQIKATRSAARRRVIREQKERLLSID